MKHATKLRIKKTSENSTLRAAKKNYNDVIFDKPASKRARHVKKKCWSMPTILALKSESNKQRVSITGAGPRNKNLKR